MERNCVVPEQFGTWIKVGGHRGERVGSRGGGLKSTDSNMTRQVVRVDRDSWEEITPLRLGEGKDTEQDMPQRKAQEVEINGEEGCMAGLREIQDNGIIVRA